MRLITSSDIERWSDVDKKDCQEYLPLLIRYLIRESITQIDYMRFPAGDATQYSGWDGILETNIRLENISEGISFWEGVSYWEIGTNKDIWDKAESDYKTRSGNQKGYDIKNSTFVFVTPRIWLDDSASNAKEKYGKNEWIDEKKKDGLWKNIVVLDARNLEEWIQNCPTTGIWLAKHIGKYPPIGIESAEDFWDWWCYNPEYKFSSKLVIAGRGEQANKLINWLEGDYKSFTLKSYTKEEAVAFLCAVIYSLEEEKKDFFLSRCLIISNEESFIQISRIHKNHILINYFDNPKRADYAASLGNHILIPSSPDESSDDIDCELGLLGREDLVISLKELGFTDDLANSYSKDSGRSLSVLRRILKFKYKQPDWAKWENSEYLLTALLIGTFDDNNEEDKKIISKLSNKPYDDFILKLNQFKKSEDPPIYNIGNKWGLISHYDSWFILAPYLAKPIIEKYFTLAYEVLGEIDPEYFLDEDERWRAQEKGAIRKYSGWLRNGVQNTIILFALYSEKTDKIELKHYIIQFVNKLLKNANDKRWFSVANILPQLAEASPETFMDCVENSIDNDNNIFVLFREGNDPMFSRCNHAGLLWALEGLAWFSEYLTRVTLILGKLAEFDKDKESRWANRPIGSLREIFLAWMPNTIASLEERLQAIDALIANNKEIAIVLLFKLMPEHYGIGNPNNKPRWRGFSQLNSKKLSGIEREPSYSSYLERLINIVGNNGILISKLIPVYDDLYIIDDRNKLYEFFESNINKISNGKFEVKESLRNLISRHKSFSTANWALPQFEIDKLQRLYDMIQYDDVQEKYKYLFDDYYPNILEVDRNNIVEFEKMIKSLRIEAVKELIKFKKLDGIINEYLNKIKFPQFFGESLSESNIISEDEEISILNLLSQSSYNLLFAQGYINNKVWNNDKEWIMKIISFFIKNNYPRDIIVNFLILLKPEEITWNIVSEFENDIQHDYWFKWTGILYDNLTKEETIYAYTKLLEHKRYITALFSASIYKKNIPTDLIVKMLLETSMYDFIEPIQKYFDAYKIADLFKVLDERGYNNKDIFIQLEWKYISILSDKLWKRPPKYLHKEMINNPNFYVEVINAIYKPKDDVEMEKQETKGMDEKMIKNRWEGAYDLLKSLDKLPGETEKGNVNFDVLKVWIDTVQELCKAKKRVFAGDYHIGELLASPDHSNDVWPPEAVCKVIEYYRNKDIEEGFYIFERNRRGTTTRGVFEGGKQEKDEAKKYYNFAKNIDPKYQRTIKLLKNIAKSYEYDADREDREAEQDKMDY